MTSGTTRGNFVSEWFGYRTYPQVRGGEEALRHQEDGTCPFLTAVTREDRECVKAPASSGVCSINNASNGVRQDWLVCPYRVLDPDLMDQIVRRLFSPEATREIMIIPAPSLAQQSHRVAFEEHVRAGGLAIAYLQDKLGGEVSLASTDRSPELSFDITLIEAVPSEDGVEIGRFGVLEVQTMDFHGSYRHAVANLKDSLRLHQQNFAEVLQDNRHWLSEKIEGPNIANVFKRTFYQMMLKFEAGVHPRCAGTALSIPQAVWDSWRRHLGEPPLSELDDGSYNLRHPEVLDPGADAWICVFDVDAAASVSPAPLVIRQMIATDAASLARYALRDVPAHAFSDAGAGATVIAAIRRRLAQWWPAVR